MKIIHKIDDFLFQIFPEVNINDKDSIIKYLENFYTSGTYKPKVTIENDFVVIDIDTIAIKAEEADYRKVIAFCEKGRYSEAKPILAKLIQKNPTNSEYHRIKGQILSDEGDQDLAINSLIDSLRWNSKNGWALVMMGNVFAKFKNDVPTAMKYYDQALIAKPNDNITLNNIGANLLQQNKFIEAKKYFLKALEINNQYPNTHYAMGLIAETEGDLKSAFNSTIQAIKLNRNKDVLFNNSINQLYEISKNMILSDEGKSIYKQYLVKLEYEGGTEIDIVEDENIPTSAKFEFAENYNRSKHTIRYKPKYPAKEHLIMHELVHLEFAIDARKEDLNQLVVSDNTHKALFIKGLEPAIRKFQKMGIPEETITNYCNGLFDGLNRQIYNTPIDLFIENFLYNEYSELRPYQFISLFTMIQEGLQAVTGKQILEFSPPDIVSKSKIYNLVNALQFKDLYGLDLIKEFKATQAELYKAQGFYNEFKDYRDDKKPAEEYELVIHWAEDLKLDKYFEIVGENQYRKRGNIDSFFESLQADPLGINEHDPIKEREMKQFQETQKSIGTNMAVVMYMVDAMKYFEDIPKEKIKKIAIDIAMQGTQGYKPEKKDYTVNSIPDKVFSGYQILAYYYVSFAIALPEMLSQLELPYDGEYELAKSMHK